MSRAVVALSPPASLMARLRPAGAPVQAAVLVVAGLLVWRLADVLRLGFGAILLFSAFATTGVALVATGLARPAPRGGSN